MHICIYAYTIYIYYVIVIVTVPNISFECPSCCFSCGRPTANGWFHPPSNGSLV